MEDYPDELRATLLPVVALWGMAPLQSVIREALERNKALRIHNYASLADVCVAKHNKRLSYEGYTPKGILKSNWMYNVVHRYASVVVMFYEWSSTDSLEAETAAWAAREAAIAQEILDMQSAVFQDGKATTNRIVVCFVASDGTVPDLSNEERITNLRRRVELQERCFLACTQLDFQSNAGSSSVGRLEAVIREMASGYYLEEARQLKKRKDIISRKQFPQLYVRNHFKIAFLNEFRGDVRVAVKYYAAAYANLREVPRERKQIMEVKALADIINFKLCNLYVQQKPNHPDHALREVISQFQKHAKTYKALVGAPEHEAEHWCWLSRQYSIMGELVGQFAGIPPSKSVPFGERPYRSTGFYFHAAASYAMERKKAAHESADKYLSEEDLLRYESVLPQVQAPLKDTSSYFGQPVTGATACDLPTDSGFAERVARQYNAPHSANIISLLKKSQAQYQSAVPTGLPSTPAGNHRMILYIISQLADEYAASEDYTTAKKLYEQILAESKFREQHWDALLTKTLRGAQLCATQLDLVEDVVRYSLELCPLYHHLNCPPELVQSELLLAVSKPSSLGVSKIKKCVTVDLARCSPLMDCTVEFHEANVHANEAIEFSVSFVSHFAAPIRFSRLEVGFDADFYAASLEDSGDIISAPSTVEAEGNSLVLLPERLRTFRFTKAAQQKATVKFTSVKLFLGREPTSVELRWDVTSWLREARVEAQPLLTLKPVITISEPEAKAEIDLRHLSPALVNEYYRTDLVLRNKGEAIQKGVVTFAIAAAAPGPAQKQADLSKSSFYLGADLEPIDPVGGLPLEGIDVNEERTFRVYIHSLTASRNRQILVKLSYSTGQYETVAIRKFPSPVVLPLAARCAFFSSSFASCIDSTGTSIQAGDKCMMRVEVQNKCPYPIEIKAADLELNENASLLTSTSHEHLDQQRCMLAAMDKFTSWFTLKPQVSGQDISIGVFKMTWKRVAHSEQLPDSEQDNAREVVTPTLVPPLKINKAPFSTDIKLPPYGVVGKPLAHSIRVVNHTSRVEDFSLSIKDSSKFLVAGTKTSVFKIVPNGSYQLTHQIVPLSAGHLPLPHFQITSKRFAKEMAATRQKQYVFVRPS